MADIRPSPSTPKLKFPDWQEPFEAALLEDDPQKLPRLVEEAEAAIFLRFQSLVNSPDGHVERNALNDEDRIWLELADIASRLAAARKQAAEDRRSAQTAHQQAHDLWCMAANLGRLARL